MYQLKIGSIPLPKVYVCENRSDASKARSMGIPYIIKPNGWDDEMLIKAVLYNTLCKMFPYIDWDMRLFGSRRRTKLPVVKVAAEYRENPGFDTDGYVTEEMQVSDGYRMTAGGFGEDGDTSWQNNSLEDFFGDFGSYVNLEELQQLKILPTWMDDIANAIKMNFNSMSYWDGYNKKLGLCTGYYSYGTDAPNLIILDVSGSIPGGVAYTMITLIDTLRHQANADLIITSGRSKFWAANEELPTPKELKGLVGGCNEARQFYEILRTKVLGKHWGNVIIFGDYDAPTERRCFVDWVRDSGENYYDACARAEIMAEEEAIKDEELQTTRVDHIMAFHTYAYDIPGYGLWAKQASPNAKIDINTEWTEFA